MIEDMVTTSSRPPGNLVIDPFAGSGTTGVAAMRTGRRAILIEQDEKHCAVAANRLQSEISS
jgi:DNA modification methylase